MMGGALARVLGWVCGFTDTGTMGPCKSQCEDLHSWQPTQATLQ